jgi:hypothetical protein
MTLRYTCQCCGCACADGKVRRVPGHVKMGRTLIEQLVCEDCHDTCHSTLESDVWDERQTMHVAQCNMCDGAFGDHGPHYAHRRALTTGEWVLLPVCHSCFELYHDHCKKLMKQGGR